MTYKRIKILEKFLCRGLPTGFGRSAVARSLALAQYAYFRSLARAKPRYFSFRGARFRYFYHYLNSTWNNERAVEVPIAWDAVRRAEGKRMLEVGNVLSQYFPCRHDVLDKYEEGRNVIRADAETFLPLRPYELIVGISTFEHIGWYEHPRDFEKGVEELRAAGWDEDPADTAKVLRVFENLQTNCLEPGGVLVATIPVGFNPHLDRYIRAGSIPFHERHFLKREREGWVEVGQKEAMAVPYQKEIPRAGAICVGIFHKPAR